MAIYLIECTSPSSFHSIPDSLPVESNASNFWSDNWTVRYQLGTSGLRDAERRGEEDGRGRGLRS